MNHNSKSKLHGIWALTNRELKKWYKEPVLFLLTMIQPILWMGLLGKSMNISALIPTNIPGIDPETIMEQTLGTSDYLSLWAWLV